MKKNSVELPQGWFHPGDIELYRSLIEKVPNGGTIIELGVWKGRSLCSIADLITKKGLTVYAVDTFKGSKNEEEEHIEAETANIESIFKENMKKFGISAKIYTMTSNEAAKRITEKFDLVFIDADHSYEGVLNDLENWIPKCRGIISGHDWELESVKKAVNKYFPTVNYIHSTNDIDRGTMWWTNINEQKKSIVIGKKIDVIIPAYKAQNTIIRTLCSITEQSIKDFITVTIVNDADGIGYSNFVNMFKDFIDIKEITLEINGGPGVARQYGIDNTFSPYFTCIDADDTFGNAFSLEILLRGVEMNPGYHTISGTFIEQHENLYFLTHQNDLIWMFGKLYTRSFINKYKIRFNDTRANEDNGFNTFIRLVSSDTEKIMFLSDIVYFWHHKEDSITRINNAQYSYDQSFVGYVDNMIYAVKEAKKVKPFNSYIDMWAIQVMAQLYVYYYQTQKRDERFLEQNYNYCKKYYKEVFKHYHETMIKENFEGIFAETISQQSHNMQDILPEKTIYQFIEDLKRDANDTI